MQLDGTKGASLLPRLSTAVCGIDIGEKNFGVCVIRDGRVVFLEDMAVVAVCANCASQGRRVIASNMRGDKYYCDKCVDNKEIKGRKRLIPKDASTLAALVLATIRRIAVPYSAVVIEYQPEKNREMTKIQHLVLGIFTALGIPCTLISAKKVDAAYLPANYYDASTTDNQRYRARKKSGIEMAIDFISNTPDPAREQWLTRLRESSKKDDMADAFLLARQGVFMLAEATANGAVARHDEKKKAPGTLIAMKKITTPLVTAMNAHALAENISSTATTVAPRKPRQQQRAAAAAKTVKKAAPSSQRLSPYFLETATATTATAAAAPASPPLSEISDTDLWSWTDDTGAAASSSSQPTSATATAATATTTAAAAATTTTTNPTERQRPPQPQQSLLELLATGSDGGAGAGTVASVPVTPPPPHAATDAAYARAAGRRPSAPPPPLRPKRGRQPTVVSRQITTNKRKLADGTISVTRVTNCVMNDGSKRTYVTTKPV